MGGKIEITCPLRYFSYKEWRSLRGKNIDVQSYLDRYDSNTLLKKLGNSIIVTGNTGTNVGDVIVYVLKVPD